MWISFPIRLLLSLILLELVSRHIEIAVSFVSLVLAVLILRLTFLLCDNSIKRLLYLLITVATYIVCSPYPFGLMSTRSNFPYITPQSTLLYLSLVLSICLALEAINRKNRFLDSLDSLFFLYLYIMLFIPVNTLSENGIHNIFSVAVLLLLVYYNVAIMPKSNNVNSRGIFTRNALSVAAICVCTVAYSTVFLRLNFNLISLMISFISIISLLIYQRNAQPFSYKSLLLNRLLILFTPLLLLIGVLYLVSYPIATVFWAR